jgi:hypothetical protein
MGCLSPCCICYLCGLPISLNTVDNLKCNGQWSQTRGFAHTKLLFITHHHSSGDIKSLFITCILQLGSTVWRETKHKFRLYNTHNHQGKTICLTRTIHRQHYKIWIRLTWHYFGWYSGLSTSLCARKKKGDVSWYVDTFLHWPLYSKTCQIIGSILVHAFCPPPNCQLDIVPRHGTSHSLAHY